jgi:hypothetical protein
MGNNAQARQSHIKFREILCLNLEVLIFLIISFKLKLIPYEIYILSPENLYGCVVHRLHQSWLEKRHRN